MPKALIPLAEGFEEIEAITIIDVLRRGEIYVTTVGLTDRRQVMGAHQVTIEVDALLADIDGKSFDLIVLPGGPGVEHLKVNQELITILQDHYETGKLIAAICAAPVVLSVAGILEDRRVTSYPTVADQLECGEYLTDPVVIDGQVVTSRGPGTALEFSLGLVEMLCGKEVSKNLKTAMLVY